MTDYRQTYRTEFEDQFRFGSEVGDTSQQALQDAVCQGALVLAAEAREFPPLASATDQWPDVEQSFVELIFEYDGNCYQ